MTSGEYLNKVPGSAALFAWGPSQLVLLGLKPPPPQRYPLSEARAALQCLADGGVLGKLVLEPWIYSDTVWGDGDVVAVMA